MTSPTVHPRPSSEALRLAQTTPGQGPSSPAGAPGTGSGSPSKAETRAESPLLPLSRTPSKTSAQGSQRRIGDPAALQRALQRDTAAPSSADDVAGDLPPAAPRTLHHASSLDAIGRSDTTGRRPELRRQASEASLAGITQEDVAQARADLIESFKAQSQGLARAMARLAPADMPPEHIETAVAKAVRRSTSDIHEAPMTEEERRADAHMKAFVETGEPPAAPGPDATPQERALHESLHEAATHAAFPAEAGDSAEVSRTKRAASAAVAFFKKVTSNEFEGTFGKISASFANVAMRNSLAVLIPTMLRQFISQGIATGYETHGASTALRTGLGALMPAIAVGTLAAGGLRDWANGTATRTSVISRAVMGVTTAAVGTYGVVKGATAEASPLMLAFTAYTFMRDVMVQSSLKLNNRHMDAHQAAGHAQDLTHFLAISLLYGAYQGLVNLGMDKLASPSGAAVVGLGLAASVIVANAFARGGLNKMGEDGEDLTFQGIPSIRSWIAHKFDPSVESKALQLHLSVEPSLRNVANAALGGAFPQRTGILSQTLVAVTLATQNKALADKADLMEAVACLIIAAANAIEYHSFAKTGSGQPLPPEPDIELAADGGHDGVGAQAHRANVAAMNAT